NHNPELSAATTQQRTTAARFADGQVGANGTVCARTDTVNIIRIGIRCATADAATGGGGAEIVARCHGVTAWTLCGIDGGAEGVIDKYHAAAAARAVCCATGIRVAAGAAAGIDGQAAALSIGQHQHGAACTATTSSIIGRIRCAA